MVSIDRVLITGWEGDVGAVGAIGDWGDFRVSAERGAHAVFVDVIWATTCCAAAEAENCPDRRWAFVATIKNKIGDDGAFRPAETWCGQLRRRERLF